MANQTIKSLRDLLDYDQTLIIRPNKGEGANYLEAVLKGADGVNIVKYEGNDPATLLRSLANKLRKLDE